MLPSRAAIVATAGEAIARGSRSFAAASRLFDRRTRERSWLLYAWCRRCDDLADGQDHGHGAGPVTDAEARLKAIRERTEAALAGQWIGDAAFDALRIVVAETGIPHALVRDVVEGFALDAAGWRPANEADLYRYCYHVAGAVGCMMAVVMGVSPDKDEVLDHACHLGIAFQLANIARDVLPDAHMGRCYLPGSWLQELGLSADKLLVLTARARVATLAARLARHAGLYAASAREGVAALPFRSAWAVLAAAGIYGDIARKVDEQGEAALDRRVTVSGTEKLGWIGRAFCQALRRPHGPPPPPSLELWIRPR